MVQERTHEGLTQELDVKNVQCSPAAESEMSLLRDLAVLVLCPPAEAYQDLSPVAVDTDAVLVLLA